MGATYRCISPEDKDKVKPCPFCKKKDNVEVLCFGKNYHFVGCCSCISDKFEYGTKECPTKDQAISEWNLRTDKPSDRPSRDTEGDLWCPLCGGRVDLKSVVKTKNSNIQFVCRKCGARSMSFKREEKGEMLKIWNLKN